MQTKRSNAPLNKTNTSKLKKSYHSIFNKSQSHADLRLKFNIGLSAPRNVIVTTSAMQDLSSTKEPGSEKFYTITLFLQNKIIRLSKSLDEIGNLRQSLKIEFENQRKVPKITRNIGYFIKKEARVNSDETSIQDFIKKVFETGDYLHSASVNTFISKGQILFPTQHIMGVLKHYPSCIKLK